MKHIPARRWVATLQVLGRQAAAGVAWLAMLSSAAAQDPVERRFNYFNDPFMQITQGISHCPVPSGPEITEAQMRAQAHYRAERGTSCYRAGRCRLPNAYLYDHDIIERVKKAVDASGQFQHTSIWAEGQRRWVTLKGCVQSRAQAQALQELVRGIDDVEAVIDELQILD